MEATSCRAARCVPLRTVDHTSRCHPIVAAHWAFPGWPCAYGSASLWLGVFILLVHLLAASSSPAQELPYKRSFGRMTPGATMAHLPEEVHQLFSDAGEFQRRYELSAAERKLGEALAWAKSHGNVAIEGVALEWIGSVRSHLGDHAGAVDHFRRAVAIFHAIGDREEEGLALEGMGNAFHLAGEPAKELSAFKQAYGVYAEMHFPYGETTAVNRVGLIYFEWGQFGLAIAAYNKALDIDRTINQTRHQAEVLRNLGAVYRAVGNPKKAVELDENALALSARSAPAHERLQYHVALALDHAFLGENNRALADLREAEALAVASRDGWGKLLVDFSRGSVLDNLGSADEARKLYESCLELLKIFRAPDLFLQAKVLKSLAASYASVGNVNRAIELYQQAADTANKLGNRGLQAEILTHVSFLARRKGKFDDAARLLEQAVGLAKQAHNLRAMVDATLELADTQAARGDAPRASALVKEALGAAQASEDVPLRGRLLAAAMRQAAQEGRVETAIFYGKGAIAAYQRIMTGMTGLSNDLNENYKNSRKGTYQELARLLMSANRLEDAQEILDLLKLREHADFVRSAPDALAGKAPTLSKVERELEDRFDKTSNQAAALGREREELLGKLERTPQDAARLRELDAQIETVNHAGERTMELLREKLLQRSPGAADPLPALREARGLRDTLRELGPGVVAIRAFLTDDSYCVILITSEVVIQKIVPVKKGEVERQIASMLGKMTSSRADPQPSAMQLYQTIVGPIARELLDAQAQTLMWSLDGPLRYIPLAALHDGNRYLVENYRIAVFTPASQSRLERSSKAQWRGLALGYTKGTRPLPNAAAELRAIVRDPTHQGAGLLDGKILLDEAFTKDAMLKALETEGPFTVVHVASHFQFMPGGDTESFLVTGGPNPRFTLAEMNDAPHLFRGVELVTLSACETAQGEIRTDGREIESLAVIAQQQGAASVLATLWAVADISTAELMRNFYSLRVLNPGMSKAEALREAQVSMLRGTAPGTPPGAPGDPKHAHPYFWAPFVLIGNWR